MHTFLKKSGALALVCLMLALIIIGRATAVGTYVNELPFRGTYTVSCGYHRICSDPPTTGWGLDFVDDVGATNGDVVIAAGSGNVSVAIDNDPQTGWGNTIVITHPDALRSRYAHLSYVFPSLYQKMGLGSPIGYMGNTGEVYGAAGGFHLHFQVYNNTDTGPGIEPIPIDGLTGSFVEDNVYNNVSIPITDAVVVDNTDIAFDLSGTATCSVNRTNGFSRTGLSGHPIFFRYCSGVSVTSTPTETGKWRVPKLPAVGYYYVYVFLPVHNSLVFTNLAEYQIYGSNGQRIAGIAINQHAYSNKWVRLGRFYFGTQKGNYILLTNRTGDGQSVAYDAVMFVRD